MVKYFVAGKGEVEKSEFDKVAAKNRKALESWDGSFEEIFKNTTCIAAIDVKGEKATA